MVKNWWNKQVTELISAWLVGFGLTGWLFDWLTDSLIDKYIDWSSVLDWAVSLSFNQLVKMLSRVYELMKLLEKTCVSNCLYLLSDFSRFLFHPLSRIFCVLALFFCFLTCIVTSFPHLALYCRIFSGGATISVFRGLSPRRGNFPFHTPKFLMIFF